METFKRSEVPRTGKFILIYSETGAGKTASTLLTAPDPIFWIPTERRSLDPTLDVIDQYRPDLKLTVAPYRTWLDLQEHLAKPENFDQYKTIFFDGFSHFMSVGLTEEILDEAYDARPEDKKKKDLASRAKSTTENIGVINALTFRTIGSLGLLAEKGKIAICTALLAESPKWNRALAAAPALKAREVPLNLPGFMDLIGLVEPRSQTVKDEDGKDKVVPLYPPSVKFESPDSDFIAKFTGVKPPNTIAWGVLDFQKILNLGKEK